MRDDIAIRVENLGKCYQIGQAKSGDLRQSFAHWWDGLRGRSNGQEKALAEKEFWALKDINFEIKRGEAVGIIGRNGAGKSTLLKILSRITEPSTGRFEINGRVSSLLEVGTGFHPELSGRENIYLNGTILGMKRREVKAKFNEIVAFSGVEKFIDTPVKHYSSGMKVRLAFSVAAHLEPEILIIDEVLAVGDAEFQKKCLGKMDEVSKNEGRTVLFVSHDMNAIQKLCSTGLMLVGGGIEIVGQVEEVINRYHQKIKYLGQLEWNQTKELTHPHFDKIIIHVSGKQPCLLLRIKFFIRSVHDHYPAFVAFDIANSRGTIIMQALPEIKPFIKFSTESQVYECEIELMGLVPDNYYISAWMGAHNTQTFDQQNEIVAFEVIDSPTAGRTFPHSPRLGSIVPVSRIIKIINERIYEK
jgi:lipopolysaccharide transport system ATP-binding protein